MRSYLSKIRILFTFEAPVALREELVDRLERCIAQAVRGRDPGARRGRGRRRAGALGPSAEPKRGWYRSGGDPLLYFIEVGGPHDTEDLDRVLARAAARSRAVGRAVTLERVTSAFARRRR
jgi:hypothetical protein